MGKVIGGGLPVGAFGASAEIMGSLAPEGPIYQAGTLSGNPLAMAAGIATLTELFAEDFYPTLAAKTERLAQGLQLRATNAGLQAACTHVGSMFSLFFRPDVPSNFLEVKESKSELFQDYFWKMLENGIYLAPSA